MTRPASVGADERLRLFLALRLPDPVLDAVEHWQRECLQDVRAVPREHLHVTVAFLGHRPAGELDAVLRELRAAAASAPEDLRLAPARYRETRSVAMLVLALCRAPGLTLGAAESCTGGLVAARLTSVPGSSDVFRGAVVAYANEVKQSALGVPAEVLERHGAVSAETAAAMASGARSRLGVDVAVSVTGVAGPGGGTPEKPVGLVYVHAHGPDGELGADFSLPADRETVRRRAAASALHLVRRLLAQSRHEHE